MTLAHVIWNRFRLADESVKAMVLLFPELGHSTNIKFSPVSKKGVRRIRSSEAVPSPLEEAKWSHTFLDRRIRKNLAEVASVAMLYLPRHYQRSESSLGATSKDVWRTAVTGAKGYASWNECRLGIMRSFLHNKNAQIAGASTDKLASVPDASKANDSQPSSFPDLLLSKKNEFPDLLLQSEQ